MPCTQVTFHLLLSSIFNLYLLDLTLIALKRVKSSHSLNLWTKIEVFHATLMVFPLLSHMVHIMDHQVEELQVLLTVHQLLYENCSCNKWDNMCYTVTEPNRLRTTQCCDKMTNSLFWHASDRSQHFSDTTTTGIQVEQCTEISKLFRNLVLTLFQLFTLLHWLL